MIKEDTQTSGWGLFWVSMCFVSIFVGLFVGAFGWFMAFVFFLCFGATEEMRKRKGFVKGSDPFTNNPIMDFTFKHPILSYVPEDSSFKRDEKLETVVTKLRLTDHAKRTLAIRHGVISPKLELSFEELVPFEEEGEQVYITKFPQLNKNKEFAVALDESKKVILTFLPHTDYERNRSYFKKFNNLDVILKDDMTKDLKELQKIWLEKIA